MAAPNLRSNAVLLTAAATTMVVIFAFAGLPCANAERVSGNPYLFDGDPGNNGYYVTSSPENCQTIITVIPTGSNVTVKCGVLGEYIYGDPFWLYVTYESYQPGFVSDFFVDCGGNQTCNYPQCPYPYSEDCNSPGPTTRCSLH